MKKFIIGLALAFMLFVGVGNAHNSFPTIESKVQTMEVFEPAPISDYVCDAVDLNVYWNQNPMDLWPLCPDGQSRDLTAIAACKTAYTNTMNIAEIVATSYNNNAINNYNIAVNAAYNAWQDCQAQYPHPYNCTNRLNTALFAACTGLKNVRASLQTTFNSTRDQAIIDYYSCVATNAPCH